MIRRATVEDIPRLVEMGQRFIAETKYRDLLVGDPERIYAIIIDLLSAPRGLVLVSEKDGALTGMIGLLVYNHPFSGLLTACEIVWWVEPEARSGRDGIRLLRAAEAWALEHGATHAQMVAPNAHVGAFYERLGYTEVETSYQRKLT